VYGEKIMDPSKPTVLVYGHYDVQPPDPLDLWHSGPFDPVIKDGMIYARGSADDKGQFYMHVKAVEAMMKTGNLPCNVKVMIEGEEEVGSTNLGIFVKNNKERLKADVVLISDTAMIANDVPSINTGLRGLSYVEVEVDRPEPRPAQRGVRRCRGQPDQCALRNDRQPARQGPTDHHPRFLRHGAELSNAERKPGRGALRRGGVHERPGHRRRARRKGLHHRRAQQHPPTLDVNGIWGGYIGEGAKTVLPSKAFAKMSMRLVPNQKSDAITKLFQDHFEKIAPPGVKVVVRPHHGGEAAVTPIDSARPTKPRARPWKRPSAKSPSPRAAAAASPSWRSSKRNSA
jgi:acetylornithine deacetylase/succinyl-diaminopimelate desuccinylase-like protein